MELFRLFGSIFVDTENADASLQNTDQNAEKVGNTFLKSVGSAAKFGIGIAAAVGAAALAVIGLSVNIGEDLQKALNGLQSETGTTDEAMKGMRESLLSIYNNNFGESFDDIAKSMALVAKQTGLTGKELESATTNALLLRDTFEMDVTGSISAVDQLMKQFGLTSEQSYNLMALGAQNGMNAQDDLVDIVKEYSVQFKGMGFNAEEMFNMLSNGAKAGGFSIDVMGDAVKEFNIRSKDGSKATGDAFKSLGLDAGALTKAFGKGGEDGKKAFISVSDALANCKDPLVQNQVGTALWGTMWEDLGAKGILALGTTKGKIDETTNALEKINAVKYNTFTEAMVGIKRNLETGILIPISEKILPALSNFSNYIIANMPIIKQYILDMTNIVLEKFDKIVVIVKDIAQNIFPGMKLSTFNLKEEVKKLVTTGLNILITALTWVRDNIPLIKGVVVGLTAVWVIQKGIVVAHNIVLGIHNGILLIANTRLLLMKGYLVALNIALGLYTAATKAGSIAQGAFNLVMGLNPIAKVILVLGLLGTAIYEVVKHWKDICTWIEKAWNWLTTWNGTKMSDKESKVVTKQITEKSNNSNGGQYGFAVGTRYLPGDMIIQAHEGEMIVPKSENPYANSKGNILNGANNTASGAPMTIQLVLQNGKAIAEFIVDDLDSLMGNKNKITGRSVGI